MTKRTETSRDVERSPGSFVALPPFTGIGVTTTGQIGRVSANCTTIEDVVLLGPLILAEHGSKADDFSVRSRSPRMA